MNEENLIELENESGGMEQLFQDFKISIFEVLFVLMQGEEREESMTAVYVQNVADYF